jgi:hypothetical protein
MPAASVESLILNRGCVMQVAAPALVPFGADQTVYLAIDSFGRGDCYREIEIERPDIEAIIADLLAGQFNEPVRVMAFNTLEHWSEDLSKEVAAEIQAQCDIENVAVPEHVRDFVERYTRQAAIRPAFCV